MKKIISIIACLFVITLASQAQNDSGTLIDLHAGYINPTGTTNQNPRSPEDPPSVYLENYTLTFATSHSEYVLYIKDENETVVYSTVVTSATKEVVLPSTLSGDYEIQLVTGNWCFWGYIEL